MIKIKAVSGPHARKVRIPTPDIDPLELLMEFALNSWRWSIDYSCATYEEQLLWGSADLSARVMAALQHGRAVRFDGREFRVINPTDLARIAREAEDAIANSGQMVTVVSDDERGVCIEPRGIEPQA